MKGFKDKSNKFHPIRGKRSPSKNRKKKFENAKIQSLIFNKKKFSNTTALEWASDHGFKAVKVEPTKNTIRIRQFSPNKIKRGTECKTIQFGGSGVQGVLCDTPERFKRTSSTKIAGMKKWGFDLTDFEPNGFQKVLKQLGIPQEFTKTWHEADPEVNLEREGRGFVWQTEGLLIETKNNPITGEYGSAGRREPEKDYAGYIGIEGTPEQVADAVKLIKKYSGSKDESPNVRNFI